MNVHVIADGLRTCGSLAANSAGVWIQSQVSAVVVRFEAILSAIVSPTLGAGYLREHPPHLFPTFRQRLQQHKNVLI